MLRMIAVAAVAGLALAAPAWSQPDVTAPYAGQQARALKALSAEQIDDLRAGRGMGLALAAELNGYPGPRHVLDLSEELALTAAQRRAFETLFQDMQSEAQRLGEAILDKETALDDAFRSGAARDDGLRETLAALGTLQGELRYIHLRTHLLARSLLNADQVAHYNVLRGYSGGGQPDALRSHQGGGHGQPRDAAPDPI